MAHHRVLVHLLIIIFNILISFFIFLRLFSPFERTFCCAQMIEFDINYLLVEFQIYMPKAFFSKRALAKGFFRTTNKFELEQILVE